MWWTTVLQLLTVIILQKSTTNCSSNKLKKECTAVLQQLHDHSQHLGIHKTTESVKQQFYWPGYESDIEIWIKECQQCQQHNPQQPWQHAPLGTIKASYPFEKVSWDIMLPLPTTAIDNKYILAVTDIFNKWTEEFPLHSTNSATLATKIMKLFASMEYHLCFTVTKVLT